MTTLIPKFDLKDGGATPTGAINRPINEKLSEIISVKDFGAKGDNSTDDTAAIQAALDYAVSLKGQTIFFPQGKYICASSLTITDSQAICLVGVGENNQQDGGSLIKYTGTGAIFLTVTGTATGNFSIEKLNIGYTSASFTGTLLKIASYGLSIKDSFFFGFSSIATAAYLLDIDKTIDAKIQHTFFSGAQYGLSGQKSDGTGYCNAVSVDQCTFNAMDVGCVRNPSQGWSFTTCDFENNNDLTGNAIYVDAACVVRGLNISSCWFADATATGAWAWLTLNGYGISINGNYFSGTGYVTADAIRAVSITGISVTGNYFGSFLNGINAGASLISNLFQAGNLFYLCANEVGGTLGNNSLTYKNAAWTPSFTNLTVVNGTGAITYAGQYQKVGNLVKFTAVITGTGTATTASTFGTTFINNLPFAPLAGSIGYDICTAVNVGTPVAYGNGYVQSSGVYPPSWSANTGPIVISGSYTTTAS